MGAAMIAMDVLPACHAHLRTRAGRASEARDALLQQARHRVADLELGGTCPERMAPTWARHELRTPLSGRRIGNRGELDDLSLLQALRGLRLLEQSLALSAMLGRISSEYRPRAACDRRRRG